MIGRLLFSAGIFLAGYFIGKQIGLTEHIRKDIEEKRNRKQISHEPDVKEPQSTAQKQQAS